MEEIKFVVNELNKPPFNKSYNLMSFDSLRGDQRLELLFQVFKEIDPKINVDILHVEDPEILIVTILDTLRIMKYVPPANINASEFRQSIILGDREITTNILQWLLSKLPALKKRAYLAQYLVKIEIAPEIEGDHDILLLYQQYQKLIEDFKTIHTSHENLKKTIGSVHEIHNDVKAMEEEKEQITQKLITIKRRVDPNSNDQLFSMVEVFKEESEKSEKMSRQLINLESELKNTQQNLNIVTQELKEAQSNYQSGVNPQDLLDKLEEEIKIKRHLIKEVLPKELDQFKRYIEDLEEIEFTPRMANDYLAKINAKIQNVNKEINKFMENKMLNNNPMDDKLALFRQNAASVTDKKRSVTEKANAAEQELKRLKEELNRHKSGLKNNEGPLKGDALKEYINSLRHKSGVYKKMRGELSEYKTETGIMERTLEILKYKDKTITETLMALEEQRGIPGYFSMQENSGIDSQKDENGKEQSADEINLSIKTLSDAINEKKTQLAPIIKDLRPLRQQCQDLQSEYEQKKQNYDSFAVGLESNFNKLAREVTKLKDDINSQESKQYLIKCQIELYETKLQIFNDDLKRLESKNEDEKEKTIIEKIQMEINNEQTKNESMKAQQKEIRDNEVSNKKQLKMWKDLQSLFNVKVKCLQQQLETKPENSQNNRKDLLIL